MWYLNFEMLTPHAIGIGYRSGKNIGSELSSLPSPVTESLGDFRSLACVPGLLLFSTLPSPVTGVGGGCQGQRKPGVEVMRCWHYR